MQTRREIIKGGLGLAGIIAAGKAPASLVRSLIAARAALTGGGKRLPYDAEVEYLESTGTQWIDTATPATSNTHVNVRFSDYSVAGAWLFGARKAYLNSALGVYTNSPSSNNEWLRAFGNKISSQFTFSTIDLGVTTFDYDCGHFVATREKVPYTIDVTDTAPAFDSSPYTIYLWTLNNGGANAYIAHAKIYGCKIWENSILVRDMIPVRVGTEGAMYDRVSGQLFRNAGTGSFVIGPDINPISARFYVNDGLIAMWDGIENAGWGVHEAAATSWKCLTNADYDLPVGQLAWESDCLTFTNDANITGSTAVSACTTIEAVVDCSGSGIQNIIACNNLTGRRLWLDEGLIGRGYYYSRPCGVYSWSVGVRMSISSALYGDADYRYWVNCNQLEVRNEIKSRPLNNMLRMGPFTGHIYNVRVYSRLLAAEEIAANYAVDKERFGLP